MAIELRAEGEAGGRYCPHVVCDVCGEPVEDAAKGNVLWHHESPKVQYFTHKGCYQRFKAGHGYTMWQPLDEFLFYLTN
jgi:hypothetical protein